MRNKNMKYLQATAIATFEVQLQYKLRKVT